MEAQNIRNEKTRVEICSQRANYSGGVMRYTTAYCGNLFKSFMIHGGVIELGPAEGVMTDLLYPCFSDDYTIVDGTAFFVSSLQERYPHMKCYTSLFEDFQPNRLHKSNNIGLRK